MESTGPTEEIAPAGSGTTGATGPTGPTGLAWPGPPSLPGRPAPRVLAGPGHLDAINRLGDQVGGAGEAFRRKD